MDRLYEIARAHKLRVIEDAAQAFGSTWRGERIGKLGDIVSFSFHANKNLTSIEGGALVLNDEDEAELARKYRLQGVTRKGLDGMDCDVLGGKYNLTDVAARVGLGQLAQIERFVGAAQDARARLLRGVRRRRGVGNSASACRSPSFENGNWHMFQITLPAGAPDDRPRRFHAETERRLPDRLGRALPGDSLCSRCTARAASRTACFRMPSASAQRRSRCRCSR